MVTPYPLHGLPDRGTMSRVAHIGRIVVPGFPHHVTQRENWRQRPPSARAYGAGARSRSAAESNGSGAIGGSHLGTLKRFSMPYTLIVYGKKEQRNGGALQLLGHP